MKTLRLFPIFMLLSMLSMGMGFPDIISDKDMAEIQANRRQKVKKAAQTEKSVCPDKADVKVVKQSEQPEDNKVRSTNKANKEAESNFIHQAATSLNNIAVKVFDIKGNLLLKEQMRMEDFLSSELSADLLPQGSTFVMFHGNTAYYFLDKQD
ncbi:hypothetical protein GXP67_06250 [Rhodocytophaga rosea]|uniref:Uncharacterized protein n=1 Tax=Rhodocytophaga rosea TaxID=2704465 RepID=A0A6C0GEF0_9BACT|nr:hypothetical protein [Rhodocytophaga rosea]QHT66287.1 hypothetical protein GXP67_06250 [Rhodocytophaga rosea]